MLTKIFSAARRPPKRLDLASARACLVTNLAVLPGLGSLLAGRRVGFLQSLLGLTGIALSLFWFCAFIKTWHESRRLPLDGGPCFVWGKWGVALWFFAGIWSIITSAKILREAREDAKPPVLR